MKKVLLAAIAVFSFGFSNAQDVNFGVKAGLMASSYDYGATTYYGYGSIGGSNASDAGAFAGGFVDFAITDKFRLQPEVLLTIVPDNLGLSVPVMLKYSFFEKFYAMAGPGLNYSFDAISDEFSPSLNLGASYDIMENLFVDARADIGISGYLGTNILAGVGYRF